MQCIPPRLWALGAGLRARRPFRIDAAGAEGDGADDDDADVDALTLSVALKNWKCRQFTFIVFLLQLQQCI